MLRPVPVRSTPFSRSLRLLRTRQGLTQMALGIEAEVSTRHLSCLESAKAAPGRDVVYRLIDALALSPTEAAELARLAGYIPPFAGSPLDRLWAAMEDSPTCLVDHDGIVRRSNATFDSLLGIVAPADDLWRWCVGDGPRRMHALIEIGLRPFLDRAEDVLAAFDARCAGLHADVEERYRVAGREARFRTVVARVGAPRDGLRLESYVPLDDATGSLLAGVRE